MIFFRCGVIAMALMFSALAVMAGVESNEQQPVVVGVAANFAPVAEAVARQFERETGTKVQIVVGSTGLLFAQIKQGAAIDVFLAADMDRPRQLARGTSVAEVYTRGRLSLWWPAAAGPVTLESFLAQAQLVALPNPRLAPYGVAAEAILARYEPIEPRWTRILGQNVGATFNQISAGSVDGGFVALSQLLAAGTPTSQYLVLPESSYPPILQGAVLTAAGESRQKAEAFLRFLLSPRVQQRLAQWGYLPVEAAVS